MKKAILVILLLMLSLPAVFCQNGGIIYGDTWAYTIMAPDGFVWDTTSLQSQGIWGLFYKAGQGKYYGNKLNMYINPVRKGDGYPTEQDSLIKWDTDYFKANNPGLVITYYKDFELGDGKTAKAYYYDDDGRKYYMTYAYITEENASFIFVLIARSKDERTQNEDAYAKLLKSFIYINKK